MHLVDDQIVLLNVLGEVDRSCSFLAQSSEEFDSRRDAKRGSGDMQLKELKRNQDFEAGEWSSTNIAKIHATAANDG